VDGDGLDRDAQQGAGAGRRRDHEDRRRCAGELVADLAGAEQGRDRAGGREQAGRAEHRGHGLAGQEQRDGGAVDAPAEAEGADDERGQAAGHRADADRCDCLDAASVGQPLQFLVGGLVRRRCGAQPFVSLRGVRVTGAPGAGGTWIAGVG
jgi:hypothetical protein